METQPLMALVRKILDNGEFTTKVIRLYNTVIPKGGINFVCSFCKKFYALPRNAVKHFNFCHADLVPTETGSVFDWEGCRKYFFEVIEIDSNPLLNFPELPHTLSTPSENTLDDNIEVIDLVDEETVCEIKPTMPLFQSTSVQCTGAEFIEESRNDVESRFNSQDCSIENLNATLNSENISQNAAVRPARKRPSSGMPKRSVASKKQNGQAKTVPSLPKPNSQRNKKTRRQKNSASNDYFETKCFTCFTCGECFMGKKNLYSHRRRFHSNYRRVSYEDPNYYQNETVSSTIVDNESVSCDSVETVGNFSTDVSTLNQHKEPLNMSFQTNCNRPPNRNIKCNKNNGTLKTKPSSSNSCVVNNQHPNLLGNNRNESFNNAQVKAVKKNPVPNTKRLNVRTLYCKKCREPFSEMKELKVHMKACPHKGRIPKVTAKSNQARTASNSVAESTCLENKSQGTSPKHRNKLYKAKEVSTTSNIEQPECDNMNGTEIRSIIKNEEVLVELDSEIDVVASTSQGSHERQANDYKMRKSMPNPHPTKYPFNSSPYYRNPNYYSQQERPFYENRRYSGNPQHSPCKSGNVGRSPGPHQRTFRPDYSHTYPRPSSFSRGRRFL